MDLNASTVDPCNLKNWQIFSSLNSKFISNVRIAVVYGSLANKALIVTKDNMVYSVGNCFEKSSISSSLCPMKIEILCGEDIKTIAYGKGHVLILMQQGKMCSWGCNCSGELGNGSTIDSKTPVFISNVLNDEFFIDIACGGHHSLALTNKGQVYAWGNMSIVGADECRTKPTWMTSLLNDKIVCISCGDSFNVVLTNNGQVYSWGDNSVGQLGTKNSSSSNTIMSHAGLYKVTALAEIIIEKIVCGHSHTLALSDKGDLYVWGDNSYGQLGFYTEMSHSYTDSYTRTPTKLIIPKLSGKVLDIATSHYHHISVARCEGNQIFMWGQCLNQEIRTPMLTPLKCLHYAFAYYAFPNIMHQPLIFDSDKETNVADSIRAAFDDPTTSDLTVQVDGKSIHVHKVILKIRSNYFKMMFQEHWTENSQSTIEHEQFSYDAYKAFLKYLYTNEIDLPIETTLELLELANAYSENQLEKHCIRIICERITVENVGSLYNISLLYNAKELEECCFKFALNHMTVIIQTTAFAELDKNTMKTFIVKAAQAGAFKT